MRGGGEKRPGRQAHHRRSRSNWIWSPLTTEPHGKVDSSAWRFSPGTAHHGKAIAFAWHSQSEKNSPPHKRVSGIVLSAALHCLPSGGNRVLVGYARVSTEDQETRLQLDALHAAGVGVVYQEKTSAVSARPELARAIEALRPGDCLIVWKLDRLARSLADLLQIIDRIRARGAAFRSLTEPVDTASPMGIFVVQVLGAVAQLERSLIIQRTTAGIRAARSRGVQWGPRPILSPDERHEVGYLASSGLPPGAIASAYGISRPLVYHLHELYQGNKKPT